VVTCTSCQQYSEIYPDACRARARRLIAVLKVGIVVALPNPSSRTLMLCSLHSSQNTKVPLNTTPQPRSAPVVAGSTRFRFQVTPPASLATAARPVLAARTPPVAAAPTGSQRSAPATRPRFMSAGRSADLFSKMQSVLPAVRNNRDKLGNRVPEPAGTCLCI